MLGGILVTSFLTPSPNIDPNSEWDMSQINSKDLLLSKIIMFYPTYGRIFQTKSF
jgi:hypothetical protein